MRRAIIAAIVALLALGGAWYWYSPRYALSQMRNAAEAGDVDTLAGYIDFPALRTSMKEELKAKAAAEMANQSDDNPFGALGAMLAVNMVDGMVDAMITPATMRKVFVKNKDRGEKGVTAVDATRADMVIEREGLDEFRLRGANENAGGALVFRRDGLGWRLAGLRMPAA